MTTMEWSILAVIAACASHMADESRVTRTFFGITPLVAITFYIVICKVWRVGA